MDGRDGRSSPPSASPDPLPHQGSSDSELRSPYHPPTQRVLEKGLEDVVMMNVDSNILETPFDDLQALPPDVVGVTPPTLPSRLGEGGPKPTRSARLPCPPGVPAEAEAKKGRAGPRRRGVPSFPQSPGTALWGVPRCAGLQPGEQGGC